MDGFSTSCCNIVYHAFILEVTMLNIISLGAGVQSSTMALMAKHGEITPLPDCAIFADTQAEPQGVYDWLDWLERELPFPVHRVTAGNLYDDLIKSAETKVRVSNPPLFTGNSALLVRKCTVDYKVMPIRKKQREMLGLAKWQRCKDVKITQWIGISLDEAHRMKPSQDKYVQHRWPLIDLRMTRNDCLLWMKRNGYPKPPKSACTFCPYHDNGMWRDMKENDPLSFQQAVVMDKAIRNGIGGTTEQLFLHRSKQPLDEVDLSTPEEHGQGWLFGNECEGMCGV
jgi:hypothetical protein